MEGQKEKYIERERYVPLVRVTFILALPFLYMELDRDNVCTSVMDCQGEPP